MMKSQPVVSLLPGAPSIYEQATWIEVVEPVTPDPLLLAQLDEGEAAVITFARTQDISLVLMDEQKGTQDCSFTDLK